MGARLHSVVVVVPDQELALDFYTRVLGWEKREDNQMAPDYRFLVVVPPGQATGIVLGPEHIHGRTAPGADRPQDTDIYMVTDDLQSDYLRWTDEGVIFDGPPQPMPWGGLGARFCDPFGNRFFITDGT
jgi:catechol 2,3-dioxygenase-like lactoylglutathione lyase family enzyme